ncbi:MAG: N-glycosylase/DNA lyase [Sulfolobales archaeon]|nr:N-glycosylase/DNA lyase [Sulfolobales archaeon]MCX8199305.1 N-glycosylase/DNA lyase [Sulfolobales archaeon]MDW8170381.1 N-glycosylase/DNA lyase [Desulfurococcaceae archaeon]
MVFEASEEKAIEIALALRNLFTDTNFNKVIELDAQYRAIRKLYDSTCSKWLTTLVAVSNALISYRLSGFGEDYWAEVASFFSERRISGVSELIEEYKYFLENFSKYNRIGVKFKEARLEKFLRSSIALKLCENPCIYAANQGGLVKELSYVMKQDVIDKTIAFAGKMYYYAASIICPSASPDPGVPMPIDGRVAYVSLISGLVKPIKDNVPLVRHRALILGKYKEVAVNAWRRVSEISHVPCIIIDTVVWLLVRTLKSSHSLSRAMSMLKRAIDEETAFKLVKVAEVLNLVPQ